MAEFAQLRFEGWADVLAEIKRLELMSPDDLSDVKNTLRQKEYAIQKTTRSLEDVLGYVEFLVDVLGNLAKTRKKLQLFEKTDAIEQKIQYAVSSILGAHERNFCNEIFYWNSRLAFAISQKWTTKALGIYDSILKYIGHTYPIYYGKASYYEWHLNPLKNMDSARSRILLGLRMHKCLELYLSGFELELRHATYLLNIMSSKLDQNAKLDWKEKNEETFQNCLQAAEIFYKQAANDCESGAIANSAVDLHKQFLELLAQFGCNGRTSELENVILKNLKSNCWKEPEAYGVIANHSFAKSDYRQGIAALDNGLSIVCTTKMHDIAIKMLSVVMKRVPLDYVDLIYKKLCTILNKGLEKQCLSEKAFEVWLYAIGSYPIIKRSKGSQVTIDKESTEKDRTAVLLKAVTIYPKNNNFRVMQLSLDKTNLDSTNKDVEGVLQVALKNDPGLSKPLLVCLHVDSQEDTIVKLAQDNATLACGYLGLMELKDGVWGARKAFSTLKCQDEYEVMKTFADIEFRNMKHKGKKEGQCKLFREVMERACQSYGATRTDVWLDFITFEKRLNNEQQVSQLYSRAVKTVHNDLKEQVTRDFWTLCNQWNQ